MPPASNSSRFYNPSLDGLRFLAFSGVFLHHVIPGDPARYAALRVPQFLAIWIAAGSRSFGGAGVDLFFVLSAYLITTLLRMEKERTGRIDIRAFYIRRVLRIWPLYYAVLLLMFATRHVWPPAPQGFGYYLASALFLGNWALAFHRGPAGAITPLWSVSVEEQFYLAWPWAAAKFRRGGMALLAAAIFLGCLAVRYWLAARGATYNQLSSNTFARMAPLGLGTLLALYPRATALLGRVRYPLALIAVAIVGIVALERPTPFGEESSYYTAVVKYPLTALLCMLIVGTLIREDSANVPVLASRPFVYLGRISYGLYLLHGAALMLFWSSERLHGRLELPAAFAVTVAAAALSYRFLERPFLALKQRYAKLPS